MDRRTEIEQALANTMLSIVNAVPSTYGYIFYNTVATVNIEDEAITQNTSGFPAISVLEGEDGEEILEGTQRAYRSKVPYVLKCEVKNDYSDITPLVGSKNAIKDKMNEMLSDVKQAISDNVTLDDTCDLVEVVNSEREYSVDGNGIRAGDLLVEVDVTYSQSRNNVNNNCTI